MIVSDVELELDSVTNVKFVFMKVNTEMLNTKKVSAWEINNYIPKFILLLKQFFESLYFIVIFFLPFS